MSINLSITDANIKPYNKKWIVQHPCNDAILAFCDSEAEAKFVRECLNDLPRCMRVEEAQKAHGVYPTKVT